MYLGVRQMLFKRETRKGIYLICGEDSFWVDHNAIEILQLCDGTRTEEELSAQLALHHPDDISIITDIKEFLNQMESDGIIIRFPEANPQIPIYQNDCPIGATIELTYRCNLRCSFCIADATLDDPKNETFLPEMSWETLERIIEDLSSFGPAPINITGGEPLLKADLVLKIAKKAREFKMEPLLLTNATLIDDQLASELYNAGIREAQVSIDSPYPDVHDQSRGVKGAFQLTLQGIESMREAGIQVSCATVVTKRNINHLDEIFQLSKNYGTHNKISEVSPLGRGLNHPDLLSSEELLQLHSRLAELETGQLAVRLLPRERCSIGTTPLINPYGEVYPCFSMRFPPFLIGNIHNQSLRSMWNDSLILKELQKWNIDDIEGCHECSNRLVCGGGCRAIAYNYHHTIYRPDSYHCKASRLFTKELLNRAEPTTQNNLIELLDLSNNNTANNEKKGA